MPPDDPLSTEGPAWPAGRFAGREPFRELVRRALAQAAREGWREIVLSDADFTDWPLGERAVVQSLQDWSASGRRCIFLARDFGPLMAQHARLVQWRRTWSHIVEGRRCAQADPLALPSAIWSPQWMLHRQDPERSRGVYGEDVARRNALREDLDEWLRRSSPGFPSHTLGL